MCLPTVGTPRRPERKTLGPAIGLTARKLGTPLTPYQQHIMDVAHELDPATNTLVYGLVVLLLPRQSGKTVLTLPRLVTKGRMWRSLGFVYTAQDRNYALTKFEEEFIPRLEDSGFRDGVDFTARLGNGKERIRFPKTRSQITIAATQKTSGHGGTKDDITIDEAFAQDDLTIDSGFAPTQITRGKLARESMGKLTPGPQLWVISAAGDDTSVYFEQKCELGRAAVERGDDRGIAYFEYSLPEKADIHDRRLWWYCIPGLGHLVDEQDIADDFTKMGEAAWRRAYMSQPERGTVEPSPITAEVWARQTAGGATMSGRLCLGLAVAFDRSRATIAAAGARPGGGWVLDVIESRPGTSWVPGRLARIREGNPDVAAVALDPGGPAGVLLADIEAAGIPVIKMTPRDVGQSAGAVLSHLEGTDEQSPDLWHLGQPELDDAVSGARRKQLGDLWVWDRRRSTTYIGPLEAGTIAFGGLFRLPDEPEDQTSVYADRGFVEW